MFTFFHPKPVVDRRPVAEHSVQVKAVALPPLTALAAPAEAKPGTGADPVDPILATPG
jgi:hypothetical protein